MSASNDDKGLGPYQILILDKLDSLSDSTKELRGELKEVKEDLTEVKTNHIAHLSASIAILQDHAEQQSIWNREHSRQHMAIEEENAKGRWKLWAAIAGGIFVVIAAYVSAHLR